MLDPAPDCDEWKESHPHCVLHSEGGTTDTIVRVTKEAASSPP